MNVNKFIILLFLLMLYWITPLSFNRELCLVYMCLFFFSIYKMIRGSIKENVIHFNVLFFLSLFLFTSILPIIHILGMQDLLWMFVQYDEKYICKSLPLCLIMIYMYNWGYLSGKKKILRNAYNNNSNARILTRISLYIFLGKIFSVSSILCLFMLFWLRGNSSSDIPGILVTLLNCMLIFSIIVCGYSNIKYKLPPFQFFLKHFLVSLSVGIVIVVLLSIGDRFTPICLTMSVIYIYDKYVKKIKTRMFVLMIIVGFLFLFMISFTRNTGETLRSGTLTFMQNNNVLVAFQDIVPINGDLLLGMEWKEQNGLHKPTRLLVNLLAPFPFIPSFLKTLFYDGDPSSAMLLTLYNRTKLNYISESGVGTHVLIDIFISWGILGVIIFFYLLGIWVGKSSVSNTIYGTVIYCLFISYSIYMSRSTIFDPLRDMIYISLIFYILDAMLNKYKITTNCH